MHTEHFIVFVWMHGRRCGKSRRKIHEYLSTPRCRLVCGDILTRGRLTDHLPGSRARVTERRKLQRFHTRPTYRRVSYAIFHRERLPPRDFPRPSFFSSRGRRIKSPRRRAVSNRLNVDDRGKWQTTRLVIERTIV